MLRKLSLVFILFLFFSSAFALSEGPNFIVLPNIKTQSLMALNRQQVMQIETRAIELVKTTLKITPASPYQTIRIRLIYNSHNQVSALIVYLLSKRTKSFELVKINVDANFKVESVIQNYHLQPEDLMQSPFHAYKRKASCPDEAVQFVIGNSFHGDSSVEREVQKIYELAKAKGYHPILLDVNDSDGPQPTVEAYTNWLSCKNVKGLYNESHGNTEGILLADDDFDYAIIEKYLVNKLNHIVILFDSCVTFYDPLLGSIADKNKGNVQQYIAGMVNLPFGPSERTASCIWTNAMKHQELNLELLEDCSSQNDLDPESFNITGNGAKYLAKAN